jgi:GAF domain-containing protein
VRLRRLQAVTSSFAEAQTLEQVRQIILTEVLSAIGANRCDFRLVTEKGLVLEEHLLHTQIDQSSLRRAGYVPLQAAHPAADVIRRGEAVFIQDTKELLQIYPNLAEDVTQDNIQANAHLPLIRGEEVFGVLSLGFSEAHLWDEAERDFALALADRAAVSYERARLFEAERRARQAAEATAKRISMLQEVATALSQALTPTQVAEVIVRASTALLNTPWARFNF